MSDDGWVVQNIVPIREQDQGSFCQDGNLPVHWWPRRNMAQSVIGMRHGERDGNLVLHVRCRPNQLPGNGEWIRSIHPDLPPQRIRWQAGIYRPRYGAILWYSSHEMFGLWFNGHHEQVMIPEVACVSKEHMLNWIAGYLKGLENAPLLSVTVMDGDLYSAGSVVVV